ncbi:MAG: putative ABC transporter permease [Sphaerochaetaceae bacterium]|nr:putative ABC transporter permease [Sphaerochaetaceae bacterium]MDC7238236.1 putative ABC transporter permease [Sphaerochaetaceae bacterium]MDC7248537.1 putative ABC transporter permease [Sphaerochaetaceae bacterium]
MINTEIIYFFIYCFVGWICEEIYCSVSAKKIVNRGFLHGPYLPIYGFGAMTVLFLLEPFINNMILLFFAGMVATSIIEYLGSFFLEKIFHIKLWDYSKNFLNINGRVCLLNSTLFGLLSLFMVYIIHPFISKYVTKLPEIVQYYIAFVIVLGMSFDFALSAAKMVSFNKALEEIRDRSEEVKEKLISLSTSDRSEVIQSIKDKWNEELATRKAKLVRNNKRIFLAFPSMGSKNQFIDNQLNKIGLELSAWILRGKKQYEELKKRHLENRTKK